MQTSAFDPLPHFYARQSAMSSPGRHAPLFDALPEYPAELCAALNGVTVLENLWIDLGVLQVPGERRQEIQLRSVEQKLARILELDERALTVPRPFERRLLCNCRDLSLLLCAMLRHQGVPARLRSGFATFFDPQRRFDHWICEYWAPDQQRWVRLDPWMYQVKSEQERLPPPLRAGMAALAYDPLDGQREYFLSGGQAWQACRAGAQTAGNFGSGDLWGEWFVADNLLRDLLALNRCEVLPWDCWGPMSGQRHPVSPGEYPLLDEAAGLTCAGEHGFGGVRQLYENTPALHPPADR